MKFGGIIVSFAEVWNVKIVHGICGVCFGRFCLCGDVCCIYCGSKQLVDCCCSVRVCAVVSVVCECEMATKGRN